MCFSLGFQHIHCIPIAQQNYVSDFNGIILRMQRILTRAVPFTEDDGSRDFGIRCVLAQLSQAYGKRGIFVLAKCQMEIIDETLRPTEV